MNLHGLYQSFKSSNLSRAKNEDDTTLISFSIVPLMNASLKRKQGNVNAPNDLDDARGRTVQNFSNFNRAIQARHRLIFKMHIWEA